MGQLILILGGARSGKSTFAEQLAQELGGEQVLYVATAEAGDEEMRQRIEKHRRERPAAWRTLEVQHGVGRAILRHAGEADVVLLDCLTLLISNLLVGVDDSVAPQAEDKIAAEVEDLIACARQLPGHFIIVSNEVGMGLVPAYPLGRAYRDLLGRANQTLVQKADEAYLLVAGIPQKLKGKGESLRQMDRQNVSSGSPFEGTIGFSRAVRVGHHVVVSGTAPIGPGGTTVGVGDAYLQTKRCIEIITQALEQAGAALEDVVRTRVFLVNIEDWEKVARAHTEVFGSIRPASTFVQVSRFINPEWLVEIEADALVK